MKKIFDDKYYIEKIKSGQVNFIKYIIDNYKNMVFTLAFRMVKNREEAEDISQEAFIRLLGFIEKYDNSTKLSTILYRIVYNLSIDYLRSQKNNFIEDFDIDEYDNYFYEQINKFDNEIIKNSIQIALSNIPSDYSFYLTLFYFEELSIKEIEQITNSSLSSIKVKLFRGRKLIESELLKLLPKEDFIGGNYGK